MNRALSVAVVAALWVGGCVAGPEVVIEPQDPELVEAGAVLYAARCAECPGFDLRETDKGPSHLSIIYEPNHHADGAFLIAIQRGSRAHLWGFGAVDLTWGASLPVRTTPSSALAVTPRPSGY